MTHEPTIFEERLLARALASGASLAGIARATAVTSSPSSRGLIAPFSGVGSAEWGDTAAWAQGSDDAVAAGNGSQVDARSDDESRVAHGNGLVFADGSVVVLAVAHPAEELSLDWWGVKGGTEGNRRLMQITETLAAWIQEESGSAAHDLPYYPDKGGTFLKDAAVAAGLGCIGKNNLLVTPEHGPRVRLRGLAVDAALHPTGPLWPDPCDGCREPCRRACPQKAFDHTVYSSITIGSLTLPGRTGCFDRDACNRQMKRDEASAEAGLVHFCRRCELSCIAGR